MYQSSFFRLHSIPQKGSFLTLEPSNDTTPKGTPDFTTPRGTPDFTTPRGTPDNIVRSSTESSESVDKKLLDIIFSDQSKDKHIQANYSNEEYLNLENSKKRPPANLQGFTSYDGVIDKDYFFLRLDTVRVQEKLKYIEENEVLCFRFVMLYPDATNTAILPLFSIGDGKESMSHAQLAFGHEAHLGSCLSAGIIGFTKTGSDISISYLSCKTGHFKCPPSSLLLTIRMLFANFNTYCFGEVHISTDLLFSTNCLLEKTSWEMLSSKLSQMGISDEITFVHNRVDYAKQNAINNIMFFKSNMSIEIDRAKRYAKQLGYNDGKIGVFKWLDRREIVLWVDDLEKQLSELEKSLSFSSLTQNLLFFVMHYNILEQALKELACANSMEKTFAAGHERSKTEAYSPWKP